jgi:hypothetical protein
MEVFTTNKAGKQAFTDYLYFWSFWILLAGLLVGTIEESVMGALKIIAALILPHILPVYLIGLLFDRFFIQKKFLLFFIIGIPFAYLSGVLINLWFHWLIRDGNIAANNEILIFFFAIMYIGYRYIKVAAGQRILLKDAENKRVIAELQYLRAQLNPHFLFNSLNSIYSLILSKSEKAGEAVLTLSELMRFHVDLSGKRFIDLSDEMALVERYIALEKLKLEDRCDIRLRIKGDVQGIKIAPLIFMPFVENAFKYGISAMPALNFVHVSVIIENHFVQFEISNSLFPQKLSENTPHIKTGIENTIKRLDLHYKGKYSYHCSDAEKKYFVKLEINLKENAD